jgi:hypothetical protein
MKSSHAIATWLFECLGLDGALNGDLREERERGRSAVWYWKQVVIAVWVGMWGVVRDHKVLALRAVVTGVAMEYLVGYFYTSIFWLAHKFNFMYPTPVSLGNWVIQLSLILLGQGATGWVVARTHRAHQVQMVFAFLTGLILWMGYDDLSFTARTFMNSIDQPRFRPYLALHLASFFTVIFGVLLGSNMARPKIALSGPRDRATLES